MPELQRFLFTFFSTTIYKQKYIFYFLRLEEIYHNEFCLEVLANKNNEKKVHIGCYVIYVDVNVLEVTIHRMSESANQRTHERDHVRFLNH